MTTPGITTSDLAIMLKETASELQTHAEELRQLDSVIGDGDLGVTVKTIDDPDPATLTLTASKETAIKLKASGETNADLPSVPQAKGGMSIEFSKSGAFLFAAEKVFAPRVGNLKEVADKIKVLKKEHRSHFLSFCPLSGFHLNTYVHVPLLGSPGRTWAMPFINQGTLSSVLI